jgi:hypothetical protein
MPVDKHLTTSDACFARVLNALMYFFYVTLIGKLLAFFSKDIATIDDVLVDNMLFFVLFWIGHTAETLSRLAVARAFHQQENFLQDN